MIFEISSEWSELNGKWIRAASIIDAIGYLHDLDCEYTFSLCEVQDVPCSDVDFEVSYGC